MTAQEMMIETELAGNVRIRLAQPFDMELDVYPKLYGALAVYALKNQYLNTVDFATSLLEKGLLADNGGYGDALLFLRKYVDRYHFNTIQEAAINILANGVTILILKEYISIKRRCKRR